MNRREARRVAHDIAATLIEEACEGGQRDDGSAWADNPADDKRIETELVALAVRHRVASLPGGGRQ